MSKNLLLINPWIYDFTAYDLWGKPLGLLYIGSFLKKFGFDINYIDCLDKHSGEDEKITVKKYGVGSYRREIIQKPEVLKHIPRKYARYGISEELFIRQLKENKAADAVLVTSIMTYWYPGVKRVVELVREHLPGAVVILGGIYATLLPEHARETVRPDYIITGPGEIKALRLLNDILKLEIDESLIPGNLDDYPYPDFELIHKPDYLVLMTARGCPYDCSFCAQKQISMNFTQRDPVRVVDEFVEQYRKFRLRDFAFYDDALFINKKRHIEVILNQLIEKRLPIRLHSPNGLFARYVDQELAELMYRSHFKTIRLSFETSNESRRKDMYSKVTNADMIQAVENLNRAGFRSKDLEAYVLMGLPGQDIEEVAASIIFVHNLGVRVRLASFSPIPGTKDFQRAVEQGYIAEDIDPLLTNKSIFPLSNESMNFETYRKLRTFSNILNEAAMRELSLFTDISIGKAIRKVIGQIQ
ncbi:MAG: radical SAM protein [Calditrichaceae bacterium]